MKEDDLSRIVIIEDNDNIRVAYESMINAYEDFTVVNSYGSCETAIKNLLRDRPELILIDLTLPGMSGAEGIARIKKLLHTVKILVVSVHDDPEHVFDALCAGAIGYVTKDLNHGELISAIKQVLSGSASMTPKIATLIIKSFHTNPNTPLTDRETDVLKNLAQGKTYDYIATDLKMSKDTVKTHLRHIYEKLQVGNKSEALIRARRDKLV